MPRVVLLVPFSSEEKSRNKIWQHVKSWLDQTLDYPMYIGEQFPETPALYNLSLARNNAATKAGDWDVAIIHDADTVINPQQIKDGVKVALETGAVTYPYSERWELDFEGTKMLLENETPGWDKNMQKYDRNQPLGGCIIVRRDLWDLVRGFDSGFEGWGHEDGAFAMACEVLSGKRLKRIEGKSLHLEHTFAPAKKHDSPIYLANKARISKYMQATKHRDAIKLIRGFREESIKYDAEYGNIWPKPNINKKGMDLTSALIFLNDITKTLDKYNCTHWLSDGTLLGAVRENNFLDHDDDMDLGVWAEDFDYRAIHELLNIYNCGIYRLQGTPEDGMIITLGRAGMHLDLFFYYPIKNLDNKSRSSNIYSCLYELIKPYNTSNKAMRYDCEFPTYEPLVRRDFLGYKFWVPKKAKKHLEAAYGADWEKPKESWSLFKDQSNLKKHGIIEDMAKERQKVAEYLQVKPLTRPVNHAVADDAAKLTAKPEGRNLKK